MKKKKFYFLLLKSDKKIGVLRAPKGVETFFGREGFPVENYESIEFVLEERNYAPFMNSDVRACFVNEDFKCMVEEVVPSDYPLEFLPMTIKSEQYGDRLYYLMHFTKIFDVIDEVNSKRVPETGDIAVPWIDYEKAKELDFFNSTAYFDGFIVSDKVRKLMKGKKLDAGIQFWEWRSV